MALGITSIFKKKVSEEKVAEGFINIIFNAVDTSFADVADLLNNDVNLVSSGKITADNQDDFLMIIISGNFKLLDNYFFEGQEDRIRELIIDKLSAIYEIDTKEMLSVIEKMHRYFKKINYPSKTTTRAMSLAVFYKYKLNEYQEEYFKNINGPDPILWKNIDDVVDQFVIKWDTITEKYRITD